MATAIDFTQERPVRRLQTNGLAGGLRLVVTKPECETNGCEVVLSPSDYAEFQTALNQPAQVIPQLAALLRERRSR